MSQTRLIAVRLLSASTFNAEKAPINPAVQFAYQWTIERRHLFTSAVWITMGSEGEQSRECSFPDAKRSEMDNTLNMVSRTRLQIRDHDFQIHVASCVDE